LKASHLPPHLWIYAVQFSAIVRNAVYNKRINTSPQALAGLPALDVTTILGFGQPVIVHLSKTASKLHYRGEQGYALCPSTHSRGYMIYIPKDHKIVDSTNFAVLRAGIHIEDDQEYDSDIFDDMINKFTKNEEYTLIQNTDTSSTSEEHYDLPNDKDIIDALSPADIPTENETSIPEDTATTIPEDIDHSIPEDIDTSIPIRDDPPILAPQAIPEILEPSYDLQSDLDEFLESIENPDTINKEISSDELRDEVIESSPIENENLSHDSESSTNSGGINYGILQDDEKVLLNRKRTRSYNDENEETNKDGIGRKDPSYKKQKHSVNFIKAIKGNKKMINAINVNPLSTAVYYNKAITYNENPVEKKLYEEAYEKEITQLNKMNTWNTTPIDASTVNPKNIISSMFIFTVKRDGKHKCRLVARGDLQKESTYSPELVANTVHHYALMTCLSNCLSNNFDIIQLDISSAYLYAKLEEELYIKAPPHMGLNNKVFKLQQSLYGLKQSGANWYKLIKNFLIKKCGMTELLGWTCVFTRKEGKKQIILCLFVDDIILFTNDRTFAERIITTLKSQFDTKIVNDGSNPNTNKYDILGLQIEYSKNNFMKFGMEKGLEDKLPKLNVNLDKIRNVPGTPGTIPTEQKFVVTKSEYKQKVKWMQKVIGLASYVAYKYRFDLLYYVNIMARFTLYPSKEVMDLAKQLVQYMWCTRRKKLTWYKNTTNTDVNQLTAVTDAAFGSQPQHKSQYGNMIFLNGNLIGAKSTRSTLTCTSSTEAEIYAISEAIPKISIIELLVEKIDNKKVTKEIITDSKPSISSFTNIDGSKLKSKFFTTRLLRAKEEIKMDNISIQYINTKDNIADILTKPVQVKDFNHLTKNWIL